MLLMKLPIGTWLSDNTPRHEVTVVVSLSCRLVLPVMKY